MAAYERGQKKKISRKDRAKDEINGTDFWGLTSFSFSERESGVMEIDAEAESACAAPAR